MMTVEDRLATVVSLLPEHEQRRFAAPFAKGESADSRLADAVQTLAKTEGLICSTKEEIARAKARVQDSMPRPTGSVHSSPTPAARISACANPQQQTAVWRSLTPMEKFDAMKDRR